MSGVIGIRREDKHQWERRVPLTPDAVGRLIDGHGLRVLVQPSPIRVFPDEDYAAVGAELAEDLDEADVVLAVKEIPEALLTEGGAYVFFSHTIKGQPQSMPMLRRLMALGCTLIDYEKIVDADGKRLVFFGRHAGLAGMIDTLWLAGQRFAALGFDTPFREVRLAHHYRDLVAAKADIRRIGDLIRRDGLPAAITPFVCGFTGDGNVSQGAQDIFDLLGGSEIQPAALAETVEAADAPTVSKVVFRERELAKPIDDAAAFDRQDYYDHPERYESAFAPYVTHLSALVNAIYWTPEYPRVLSKSMLRSLFAAGETPRLRVVGDITCDIDGSIECTFKATTPGEPSFVYDPAAETYTDGVEGPGLALMTTDCLPCELPRESSTSFTDALFPFVPALATARRGGPLADAGLPPEIERATILWRGALTPDYAYLAEHVEREDG